MPVLSEKLVAYYVRARLRAQRRKSAWNALLVPICFGAWIGIWYALFRLVWAFHIGLYPQHRLADFWPRGISAGSFALSFLMVFALMPAAMALGFMLGNGMLWLIPGARRGLDVEARDHPGTNFADAMRDLFKIGVFVLPLGLIISCAAAYFLGSLR
jgi:hypothetical protein